MPDANTPDKILSVVWSYLEAKRPKPSIELRQQHATGRYLCSSHAIQLRANSWAKMQLAEKRLIIIHEALHARGLNHQEGFRSALDTLAHMAYWRIWGQDEAWETFLTSLEHLLPKTVGIEVI